MDNRSRDSFGRREEDDRWRELTSQLKELVSAVHSTQVKLDALKSKVDEKSSELDDEVDTLKEFVLGGAVHGRTSLETRLHDVENATQEHKLALKGGDILSPDKGLIGRVSKLETGEVSKNAKRGMIVALTGSLLLFLGTLTTVLVSNSDKLKTFFKKDDRGALERLRDGIAKEKKNPRTRQRIKEEYGVDEP